ncbi:MAG TPA: response regulator [Vicinamibacteria bacterium]|nr:response regulator [Vicinamibacteria bacterium]
MTGGIPKNALPTVLVVDDDPWILELVKDMLSSEPCRVVSTSEPIKALPLMEWERVDVIVADIAMPEVDGVDLIVRAKKLFPTVPRILLTAAPTLERIIRSVNEADVYRVLVKPVSPKVLRETIREALLFRLEREGEAAARHGSQDQTQRLFELSREHPGIGSVVTAAGVYVLTSERLRELDERFRSGPFATVLRPPSAASGTLPQV